MNTKQKIHQDMTNYCAV